MVQVPLLHIPMLYFSVRGKVLMVPYVTFYSHVILVDLLLLLLGYEPCKYFGLLVPYGGSILHVLMLMTRALHSTGTVTATATAALLQVIPVELSDARKHWYHQCITKQQPHMFFFGGFRTKTFMHREVVDPPEWQSAVHVFLCKYRQLHLSLC